MKLIKYMKKFKIRQKKLAEALKLTQGAVSHKMIGKRQWTPKQALEIEKYTKGLVSRMDVLYPNNR